MLVYSSETCFFITKTFYLSRLCKCTLLTTNICFVFRQKSILELALKSYSHNKCIFICQIYTFLQLGRLNNTIYLPFPQKTTPLCM